jgi:hypothetical protein
MTGAQGSFTRLESQVLEAICARDADGEALRGFLATARVTARDITGLGFYTTFAGERESFPRFRDAWMRDGPLAHVPPLGPGALMGFILWFEDGYPDCLEGYQYGDERGETVDLDRWILANIVAQRLEWAP